MEDWETPGKRDVRVLWMGLGMVGGVGVEGGEVEGRLEWRVLVAREVVGENERAGSVLKLLEELEGG